MIIGEYEPATSREAAVIGALRTALVPGGRGSINLNSTDASATGVCLADRWVTRMEIIDAVTRLYRCEPQQAAVIVLLHGQDYTSREAAGELHIDRNTLAIEEAAGLQQIVRWLWAEPAYESPPRLRPRRSILAFVERTARKPYARRAS